MSIRIQMLVMVSWMFLLAVPPSRAQSPAAADGGPPAALMTQHVGTFNTHRVEYQAIVEPIMVADATGKPAARLVSIAYVATNAGERARRPLLFVFNGGPIVASYPLHMGAFGPQRVAVPDDLSADPATFRLVDNPNTVLDVADIVFFDPAGTGYSRVLPGVDPKSDYSVTADAQQLGQFIIEWSRQHERLDSPKYLLGESYGTLRAAATANQLQKLPTPVPIDGVVLMGQALNIIEFSQRPANVTSYVVSLPTLAAIAWYHQKGDRHGRSFEQFVDAAWRFTRTDYLTALFQGSSLDDRTRRRIARQLEEFTGIPAAFYLANDLRITKERYRVELFKDQHLVLGMMDARYIAPLSPTGATDPSMAIVAAYETAFKSYLHSQLGLGDNVGEYITADPVTAGLEGWQWSGGTTPFSDWPYMSLLSEVFAANPHFRVMIGNGWQDTQTTVGAAQLALDQSGWPRERTSIHFYQGGHVTYSVEDSLRRLTQDVRDFITQR